jgi:oligopeptide/dipeptide ABC transporter ATP-binding protein
MYLGKVAEIAPQADLYRNPKHPYTGTLLSAVPIPDPDRAQTKNRIILQGDVPSPIDPPEVPVPSPLPQGAATQVPRDPRTEEMGAGHLAACHFPLTGPDDLRARTDEIPAAG